VGQPPPVLSSFSPLSPSPVSHDLRNELEKGLNKEKLREKRPTAVALCVTIDLDSSNTEAQSVEMVPPSIGKV
jgi:hypothetical protein